MPNLVPFLAAVATGRRRSLLPGCLLLALPAMAQSVPGWTNPAVAGPSARSGGFAVFDAAREQTVLFGGLVPGGVSIGETWIHDGVSWTQRQVTGPGARNNGGYTYDPLRRRMVLFGGYDGFSWLNDLWSWDGAAWTQLTPTGSLPGVRAGGALTFDPVRDRVVLFGGSPGGTNRLGDTWEYDGSAWTNTTNLGPSPRTTRIVYDEGRGAVVLFSGSTGSSRPTDTWTYANFVWTPLVTGTAPSGRWRHGIAYDRVRGQVLVFGGDTLAGISSDVWTLSGSTWTQVLPSGTPPTGRYFPTFVRDEGRDACVVFGGTTGTTVYQDTWQLARNPSAEYRTVATGCAGSLGVPAIRRTNTLPRLGSTHTVEVTGVPAPFLAWMAFGFGNATWSGLPLPLDLTAFGMPGCFLHVDAQAFVGMAAAGGVATSSLAIPNLPGLLGVPFYQQALVLDPGVNAASAVISNAMRGVVGQP